MGITTIAAKMAIIIKVLCTHIIAIQKLSLPRVVTQIFKSRFNLSNISTPGFVLGVYHIVIIIVC